MPDIHVSAAVIVDRAGHALVVRKHGTTRFMQPGGKPEPGETAAQTLIRELDEELALRVDETALQPLGRFISAAANEPDHRVVAEAFALRAESSDVVVQAELAELRWLAPGDMHSVPLAPLSVEHLLPLAWR
ncbi:NUDIX domain-containing protein [Microbacterium esteraromaticum]|uniref:8-oxo-dGTP diphosphatase n=1 Tax=Microbacterium esteraromaticum TaxID=57043 RepID=A0A939DUJ4_9MICO|nr:NUDIX domain-containing protein [Microbacterium esteraromaticum]MBN7793254.1 NUDIX domain-containing protein [Microbacterium esteraromaticum]MBN8205466.1 NUDIX domain-containing protein [Microbacterium esteraromaticum]MBN8415620.1 NUDIX domain-containing protein [Microbacterium esteraromaticum]MBN8424034.1 NUDIX domain-containing protein [Microbacterium esteraromaticum]